jgi:hypothetical protein
VCNDGFVCTNGKANSRIPIEKYGIFSPPPPSKDVKFIPLAKFKPLIVEKTFMKAEFAVDMDEKSVLGGTIQEQWKPLFDCTHFVSCCIGEPHGKGFHIDETAGGLPILYRQFGEPPSGPYGITNVDTMVHYLIQPGVLKLRDKIINWRVKRGNRDPFAKIIAEKRTEDEINKEKLLNSLKPGDLIAYSHSGINDFVHMTIYLGNGKIACHTYCRSDQPECLWDNDWNIKFGDDTVYTFIQFIV